MRFPARLSVLLLVLAAGCDAQTDPPVAPPPVTPPAAAPVVTGVFPSVVVPGSFVYVSGENFGADASAVTVGFRSPLGAVVDGLVTEAAGTRLTVKAPAALPVTGEPLVLVVTTAAGSAEPTGQPVYGVASSAFGNDFEAGRGLIGRVYPLATGTPRLPDVDPLTPASVILAPNLDVPTRSFTEGFPGVPGSLVEWFGIRFDARLDAPAAGTYAFRLASDDGSKLYVDGVLVVDNDGLHGTSSVSGTTALTAGVHDVRVDYFQGPRTQIALQLFWTPPGAAEAIIPTSSIPLPDLSLFLPAQP